MVTNFDFLKQIDKNLYEIISDAEMLYRDEYYDQCIMQSRKFAENVCKLVLGDRRKSDDTFDDMLATLKDASLGSEQEKEFIEDLYFLKRCGNQSVHSSQVQKDGINALECLQRAFEVGINYCVYAKNAGKNYLDLHFDIELLATGKKNKKLAKEYMKAKENYQNKDTEKPVKKNNKKPAKTKQQSAMKSCPKPQGISPYWIVVGVFSIISFVLIIYLLIIN